MAGDLRDKYSMSPGDSLGYQGDGFTPTPLSFTDFNRLTENIKFCVSVVTP